MAFSTGLRRFCIAATLALTASAASAAVVPFSISGSYSQGVGQSDFGGCFAGLSISLGGAGSFLLDPGCSGSYFDVRLPGGTFSTTNSSLADYYFLRSYMLGDTIGVGNFGSEISAEADWDTILVADSTLGVWNNSHAGYLGFNTSAGLFGWIEYSYSRNNGVSTLEFMRGAYNDSARADIIAGDEGDRRDVPAPGPLALLLTGLLAAAGLRRRLSK